MEKQQVEGDTAGRRRNNRQKEKQQVGRRRNNRLKEKQQVEGETESNNKKQKEKEKLIEKKQKNKKKQGKKVYKINGLCGLCLYTRIIKGPNKHFRKRKHFFCFYENKTNILNCVLDIADQCPAKNLVEYLEHSVEIFNMAKKMI